ncbi:HalOD1 output domain-containing protein [Natrialbaceae archaeon GCM10025810]|uniref:HalOD1 output domain-containing protein n=1 Tax=Halovalidus salilacus TaxID=3075124 RepID=UPI00361ED906
MDDHSPIRNSNSTAEANSSGFSTTISASLPSIAVVEAIARQEGVDPVDLTPPDYELLRDVVDPDALDALCSRSDGRKTTVEVRFSFNGYEVSVAGDGSVAVRPDPTDRSRTATR